MSGITILDHANAPMGPFTREQVVEKLQRGEVTLISLAFVDGLAQWTPLRDVLARVDAANPPTPAIPTPATTSSSPALNAPLAPVPSYSYAASMEPPAHLIYAGFWIRFLAHFIDAVVMIGTLMVAGTILFLPFAFSLAGQNSAGHGDNVSSPSTTMLVVLVCLELLFYGAAFVGGWLYFALLESGKWEGTVGKRLLGLRVTGMDGQRIGFGRASGRYFAKILSGMAMFIGYIMCAFTPRKQALHDMIAGTLVVRNSPPHA